MDFVRRFVNQFRTFRQVASRRSRRRLLQISPEQLECRALLAAVTDAGNTLRIELEAGEQLDIQSNGSSYTFGSSNAVFTDGGVFDAGDFTGFGSDNLTLVQPPQYVTIQIVDAAAGASVEFVAPGAGIFQHEFDIVLDDLAAPEALIFTGGASFGSYPVNATVDGAIVIGNGAQLWTSDGGISLTAVNQTDGAVVKRGITVTGGEITTTGSGDIVLNGTASGGTQLDNLDGVAISATSTVQSTSSDTDAGEIRITGLSGGGDDFETGVWIADSTVTSVVGAVAIDGTGADGSGTDHFGVSISSSVISSTGTGSSAASIAIHGAGGAGTDFGVGVGLLNGSRLSTVLGDITLDGRGGDGTGHSNNGFRISDSVVESTGVGADAGDIRLTGNGGGGTSFGTGGIIEGNATQISAVDGNIEISGDAGSAVSGESNRGVSIGSGIHATGTGFISVTGIGRSGTDFSHGVDIFTGAEFSTQTGTISITGTGGSGAEWNYGVSIRDTHIQSVEGNLVITGNGGQGTEESNRGIDLSGDYRLESTGTGPDAADILLNGTSGTGTNFNIGVVSFNPDTPNDGIYSVDGDVVIVGSAVAGATGHNNPGVTLLGSVSVTGIGNVSIDGTSAGGAHLNRGVRINADSRVSTNSGSLSVIGRGSQLSGGNENEGVVVVNGGAVESTSGDILVHGISGSNNSHGVELFGTQAAGGRVYSQSGDIEIIAEGQGSGEKDDFKLYANSTVGGRDASGDITIRTDTIDLDATSWIHSQGPLTIQPRTAGTADQRITLGAADTDSRTDLNLTQQELMRLSPGFQSITFGTPQLADNRNYVTVDALPLTLPVVLHGGTITGADVPGADLNDVTFHGQVTLPRGGLSSAADVTLASGSLQLNFAGDQPGMAPLGFDQLKTTGSVDISGGVELLPVWEPAWRPKGGESLTIVQRTGGVGTFAGLAEGATLTSFFNATISYVGGDGDDIVLTLPASVNVPKYAQLDQFASTGITLFGEDPEGTAGHSVSAAGDVNGDGQPDFLVSANFAQGPGDAPESSGLVYLIYGRPDLPSQIDLADIDQYGVLFVGAGSYDTTGHFVDASDFNQDGYDDVLIGAFRREGINNEHDAGGGYVIWGGASLPSVIDLAALGSLGVTIYGPDPDDLVGNPVAHVGDLNDDGYPDFGLGAIWADGEDNTGERVGEAYIVYGGATLPEQIDLATVTSGVTRIYGHQSDDETGVSVERLGDVNGDDIDDLLIGARYADGPGDAAFRAGESYIIYGSATIPEVIRLGSDADVTIYGTDAYDFSGWRADPGGDVNADGYNDILIGALGADSVNNARINAGEVYLIFGGPALPAEIHTNNLGHQGVTIFGADTNDTAGRSVDIVGDLNADGYDDIAIGADNSSGLNDAVGLAGEVSIFLGRGSWPSSFDLNVADTADFTLYGIDAGDGAGIHVRGVGDLNNDGIDDLMVGAHKADSWNNSRPDAGEAYIISGQSLFVPVNPVVYSPSGTSRETRPTIEWYASTEAESYELWLEHIGGDANPVINPTVAGTSYTLLQDLDIGRYRAWVRANKEGGSKSVWTSVTFTVTVPATIVPLTFTGDLTPTIDWSDVPGAVDYRVYIQNTTTLETVLDERVSVSQLDITTDLAFGRHRIWVQATGINGFTAEWSDSVDYQVQPQQLGPFEPTLNVRPTFSWTQMEGVESVQLWVQRGSTVVINETGLTGTSYTPSEDLAFGLYRWWIRPVAANGRSAGWSPLGEFNVGGQTTITAPSGPVDNGLAVIEWLPVDGAVSYEVYLATTSGQLIRYVEGLTGTTFDSPPLQDDSYVVWVRSHADGTPGLWSRPLGFDVVSAAGLTAQPADSQRTTFALRPTLQWTGSSAATYNVYITGGATTILQQSIEGTQWTVTTDLPEGLWTWYVQAANEGGQTGEWSDPATIDTSGRAIVLAPTGAQSALRPTFTWGVVEGAVEYILYVENRDTGMQVLNETGLTGTEFTPDFDFDRASFRVWVRAVSLSKAGPWSLFVDFQLV
ncbi:MAG: integrin alpha [Planctomycetaceae bacterium]|nr:integrin alpha [Planctomycetaceae bacterium]